MNIWITSDTHFSHANVIKYCNRPFKDAQEMDEKIVLNWNTIVCPGDTVIHLGDFALSAAAVEKYVKRLNGNISLILGNHDFPHPAHQKGKKLDLREKWTKEYLKYGIKDIKLESSLSILGVSNFRLFHLPYEDSSDTHQDGKPRHFKERLPDDGVPLLCGHVHNNWLFRRTSKGTPMLNVGIDAPGTDWNKEFRPASLEEIIEQYKKCVVS